MLVQVANPEYGRQAVWLFEQPQFFEYEGQEVAVKHVGPHELALSTGNPEWPIRVIQRHRIVSIDGVAYSVKPSLETRTVKGSRGEIYTVTLGARPTCTCTGFQYRKTCRHIVAP